MKLNKKSLPLILAFVVLFLSYLNFPKPEGSVPTPSSPSQTVMPSVSPKIATNSATVLVTKVIDGDTIEVNLGGETKKVRYIGVDTPETVDPRRGVQCFGREASDENKRLVLGKNIILEKDISEVDKYNRLLRYIYLPLDDGQILFVNDYLIRSGYALSSTYPPDVKFVQRFNQAQVEAREAKRGLWGKCYDESS